MACAVSRAQPSGTGTGLRPEQGRSLALYEASVHPAQYAAGADCSAEGNRNVGAMKPRSGRARSYGHQVVFPPAPAEVSQTAGGTLRNAWLARWEAQVASTSHAHCKSGSVVDLAYPVQRSSPVCSSGLSPCRNHKHETL